MCPKRRSREASPTRRTAPASAGKRRSISNVPFLHWKIWGDQAIGTCDSSGCHLEGGYLEADLLSGNRVSKTGAYFDSGTMFLDLPDYDEKTAAGLYEAVDCFLTTITNPNTSAPGNTPISTGRPASTTRGMRICPASSERPPRKTPTRAGSAEPRTGRRPTRHASP